MVVSMTKIKEAELIRRVKSVLMKIGTDNSSICIDEYTYFKEGVYMHYYSLEHPYDPYDNKWVIDVAMFGYKYHDYGYYCIPDVEIEVPKEVINFLNHYLGAA